VRILRLWDIAANMGYRFTTPTRGVTLRQRFWLAQLVIGLLVQPPAGAGPPGAVRALRIDPMPPVGHEYRNVLATIGSGIYPAGMEHAPSCSTGQTAGRAPERATSSAGFATAAIRCPRQDRYARNDSTKEYRRPEHQLDPGCMEVLVVADQYSASAKASKRMQTVT
jgi:hypothetical protein